MRPDDGGRPHGGRRRHDRRPRLGTAIATIDPDFKFPKYLKATLGFDRRLSNGLIGTIEGLYTRSQNNAFYQNLALAGPRRAPVDRTAACSTAACTATGAVGEHKGRAAPRCST